MAEEQNGQGMLAPYRVLDLTDEKGLICGKIMGDLGADVIKVERPGGDTARNLGPFYHDEPDPEKSLFWFAYNTSKRSITLDIETVAGQKTFKKLVESSDFVIESFPPGYMDKLGLGYSALEKVNPGIIMVSISPFGQTGPYRDYKAPDIVAWAMGGVMYQFGDADRPPVRFSHHSQAYLNAGTEAVVGALLALQHRYMTGKGQYVDLSIQETVAWCTERLTAFWDVLKFIQRRGGVAGAFSNVTIRMKQTWPCKDGHVMWTSFGAVKDRNLEVVKWLEDEGAADDFLRGINWDTFSPLTTTQDVMDRLEEPIGTFLMAHTKAELLEGAVKHRVQLYPYSTTKEIVESAQLAAREFWVEVKHPELGTTITYPGAFAKASKTPPRISRRAPLIGEHNREIYEKELTLSKEELLTFERAKGYPCNINGKNERENLKKKPLEGIRVIDFSWIVMGPLSTRTLADYGAEVIKIEGRSKPDGYREVAPCKDNIPGWNRGGGFASENAGKLSVSLNLANPKAKEVAKKFVAQADIVVENFSGGTMKRMGLGFEELQKVKPDIIMLSACMQGQTGPHAAHPGRGYQLTALAGLNYIAGWPDRPPAPLLPAYTDYVAPRFNTLSILAALDYRRRTGKGQYLDMSGFEHGVQYMSPLILDYVVNKRVAGRVGNKYPYAAPHSAYRCRGEDRWCVIAVFTDEEWESFCKVIGNPAWTKYPKFTTLQMRKEHEEELDRLVEKWTINYLPEEIMTMMQTAGVAGGVVETSEDLMEHDPQLRHRHFFWELDHPELGKHRVRGPSFVLSNAPCEVRRAPLMGEHNEYTMKKILGMSDDEVAQLVIEGVIE